MLLVPVLLVLSFSPKAEGASVNFQDSDFVDILNDWQAVGIVLADLDRRLTERGQLATVLLVDDASTDPLPAQPVSGPLQSIQRIELLRLRCNSVFPLCFLYVIIKEFRCKCHR